ncbi:MAG: LysR family transcriptional regulator [Lautropia sp.]
MLKEIDLSRVDLNLLTLFEVVFRERHVGHAAERLHLTASAVSHGLGRLRRLLNDPLFLRTPKGVVPTERALALQAPVADALARLRSVIASAGPFDPATSRRRFTIAAPDGVSAVFLPALLADLSRCAPGIDMGIRQSLPAAGATSPERAWQGAFDELEARTIDAAVIPSDHVPARFARHVLYQEDFVLAMRADHPFARAPTLDRYCAERHLVVSLTGDPHGFVDDVLARSGRSRRVAATVPNFMFALALVAQTDLICAIPRRFAGIYAARHAVAAVDSPVALGAFRLHLVVPEVALMDAGVAWLVERMLASAGPPKARSGVPRASGRGRQQPGGRSRQPGGGSRQPGR